MPLSTNIIENLEEETNSPKSSQIITDTTTENGNSESGESEKRNRSSQAINYSTNNLCPSTSFQLQSSNSKRIVNENKTDREKLSVVANSNMALQQQVSEKLKALSERLKITRNQHFNSDSTKRQQQPTSTTNVQGSQVATKSLKSMTKNERSRKSDAPVKAAPAISNNQLKKSCRKEIEQKSREQLEAEISALHKLLGQLSLESPELRSRILSIAHEIPELKQTDVAKLQRLEGGLDNDDEGEQGASTSKAMKNHKRPHLESTGQLSCDTVNEEEGSIEKRSRKRGRRGGKKRKNSTKQKCQVSELRDLAKYINNIVEEYLLKDELLAASVRPNLENFHGNFNDLEEYAAQLVKLGLGRIVEDEIRVNRKNNRQSFVTMSTDRETLERDGMVMLPVARRYAFEGDIVRAFVFNASLSSESSNKKTGEKSKLSIKDTEEIVTDDDALYEGSDSPDSDLDSDQLLDVTGPAMAINCPKAFVIEILKHTDDRKAVGTISFRRTTQLSGDNGNFYYKFRPLDTRMPLMYVPERVGALHADFAKSQKEMTDFLYLAQVCETDVNGHCIAELLEKVGNVGHLEHELKAILLHNGFKDIKPYEHRFEDLFTDPSVPPLTENEMKHREDLRNKCIFTVDPATARDLDDALSIDEISENEFEVGVHIADVSYFLEEGCELDDIVKNRATSIYLVNEVIHMLPVNLCYKCSLLPGEDKFAFSVFWRMDCLGNVLGSPRFTRSVVNSCTKFAYTHAQKFIENPEAHINADDFPDIYNGYTLPMIAKRIKVLQKMAENMRRRRFENGALSINNPKLRFDLDPLTGEPISYEIDKQLEANHLIEEFMLLANISVARHIYKHFPNVSLLRNHEPPLMTSLKNLQEKLLNFGLNLDCSSSKAIYLSIQRICNEAKDPKAMNACISTLLTKPMARAKYFCSEDKTESEMWHYALSIPIYTHFTSPIRRYPDILVHRLLAATLNYCSPPQRTADDLRELAKICNVQKYNAKNASDESTQLYFKRFVKAKQGLKLRAAVLEIYKHLVNVITVETGHVLPIQYKEQKVIVDTSNVPTSIEISEKGSRQQPVKLQMFSSVDIKLVIRDEKLVAFFVSPDLKQRQINCIGTKNTPTQKIGKPIQLTPKQEQPLQQSSNKKCQKIMIAKSCHIEGNNN